MRRTIFLCTTPRSGSEYLSDLINRNGIPSIGESLNYYLNSPTCSLVGLEDFAIKAHAANNNMFCAKLFPFSMQKLTQSLDGLRLFPQYFGEVDYVYLSRGNTWRQAVSHYIANNTAQWTHQPDQVNNKKEIPFHFTDINYIHEQILARQTAWHQFFLAYKIVPKVVNYEDLTYDYVSVTRTLLRSLGVEVTDIKPSTVVKQTTELNEKLYQQVKKIIQ